MNRISSNHCRTHWLVPGPGRKLAVSLRLADFEKRTPSFQIHLPTVAHIAPIISPIVSLIAGGLILIMPRFLTFIVAASLILNGLLGLGLLKWLHLERRAGGSFAPMPRATRDYLRPSIPAIAAKATATAVTTMATWMKSLSRVTRVPSPGVADSHPARIQPLLEILLLLLGIRLSPLVIQILHREL